MAENGAFVKVRKMRGIFTGRVLAVHVKPDFDRAEGEREELGDLCVGREASAGGAEEGDGVKDGAATFLRPADVRRRDVELAMDLAKSDEVLAPVHH